MRNRAPLIIAAAGSILLSAACSSSGSGDGTPVPAASSAPPSSGIAPGWTSGLDSRPTRAIVEAAGVFVTTAGASNFPPQVYLLALDDGRQLAHHTAVGQPNDLAVAPDGQLWVATERHIDQPAGTGINVHDPRSLVVGGHIDLPDTPLSLAQVGGSMWAGAGDAVFVVDPSSRQLTSTIPIGGPAYQLLLLDDGEHVLVVEGDALEVLALDGTSVARVAVPAAGSISAALAGDVVWVRVPVDVDSELRSYTLPDLAAGAVGPALDAVGGGVVVAGGVTWATDERAESIVCVTADGAASTLPGDGALGVLAALQVPRGGGGGVDDELVLATTAGVALRPATCG